MILPVSCDANFSSLHSGEENKTETDEAVLRYWDPEPRYLIPTWCRRVESEMFIPFLSDSANDLRMIWKLREKKNSAEMNSNT